VTRGPRRSAALLLVLLLSASVPTVQSGTTGGPEWFGPSGADEGWHMRINLTVKNQFDAPMVNAPVAAELDLARALLEAGWTGFDSGGAASLTGFTLDLASFRVVQYHDLGEFTGSGSAGRIKGEVPSLVLPGLLGREDPAQALRPFDASSSPLVTVFFRVPGTLAPGAEAFFQVYFDSARNGLKPDAGYTGPAAGALEGLHWSTAGVRLYGMVETTGGANQVHVQALHPGTQVTVSRLAAGQFRTDGVTMPGGNPATLAAGQVVTATLGVGEDPIFRVDATAPVVAAVDPVGFVPSADGGLAGNRFAFRTPRVGSAGGGETGVYFINVGTAAATVTVTPVDGTGAPTGGQPVTYNVPALPDAPYRGSAECSSAPPGYVRLSANQAYTATVAGGPILVQLQPRVQQQVPTVAGAPSGTRFLATMGWSSFSNCPGNGQPFLAANDGPTAATLRVSSLEEAIQVSPPGNPGNPRPAPHPIPAAPAFSGPLAFDPGRTAARDRPLSLEASAPMRVFAGGVPDNGIMSGAAGPLGGSRAGTSFASPAATLVVAPYPETVVTAQVTYAFGSGTVTRQLGANGATAIGEDPELGRVLSMRLQSNRPVVAYPLGKSPGWLAGVPGYLEAEPGVAQYRGRLIEIRSQTGDDPLTVTVKPGETTAIPLTVANRGKGVAGAEGPFETVRVNVSGLPDGWTARFDRGDAASAFVSLASDQEDTLNLLVQPPSGLGSDAPPATLTVTARSMDRREVGDEITVVAFVKTSFGVGLWFLQPVTGPKTASQNAAPGTTAVYPVFVKNLGSVDDTILLAPTTVGDADAARLRDRGGNVVTALAMAPGQVVRLNLTVDAGEVNDALLLTTVTGKSEKASSGLDRITALTRVRTASDLNLTSPEALKLIRDGEEGRFEALVTNPGGSAADVRVHVLSDVPAGWARPTVFLRDPVTGARVPLMGTANRLTLDAGSEQTLHLNVTAPAGTPAGLVVTLQLVVTPSPGTPAELTLTGVVAARHRVSVLPAEDPVRARPGRLLDVPLTLRNAGNLAENLTAEVADAPPGWTVLPPAPVDLARNATGAASLRLNPGPAAPGLYPVALRFVSADGTGTELSLNVTVPSLVGEAGNVTLALQGQPGQPLEFRVPVSNTGNQVVTAGVERGPGEPWAVAAGNRSVMAPGANATLPAALLVPRDAPDGRSVHRIAVVLVAQDGSASRTELDLPVDLGRPNLRLENVSVASGPAGGLVRAVVVNDGQRPAVGLRVAVRGGEEDLGEQVIGRLEAGERADLLLAVSGAIPGGATLRADPADAIVEASEDDNSVGFDGSAKEAPGPGAAALLAALAAVALALAGRRRQR
jgi:uncharacterized membrane protein